MSDNKDSLRDQQHAFFQTPQQKGDASVSPISNQPAGQIKTFQSGIVSIIIVLILALVGSGYYISRRLNDGVQSKISSTNR